MLNLQRNFSSVSTDFRVNPRIEFHYPVVIIGVDANAHIIDFSLGGFYIQTDSPLRMVKNQKVKLIIKLPEERAGVTVKVEVVHLDENGFGCRLCDPQPDVNRVLSNYFNMFSGMLPIE